MKQRHFFFDTETTCLLPKRGDQGPLPFIVQLGFMMVDMGREQALFHCLIKPKGWVIPEESTRIHGITTEMCERCGIDIEEAMLLFKSFSDSPGLMVAHNYEFDAAVIDLELQRLGFQAGTFSDTRQFCTMKAATPLVNAKGVNSRGSFTKYPKLSEAYEYFTGRPMEADGFAAHSAIGDVQACRVVYDHLVRVTVNA